MFRILVVLASIAGLMSVMACKGKKEVPLHPAYLNPAVKPYTDSIQVYPDVPVYYVQRSAALMNVGADSLAIVDLQKAISLEPRSLENRISLGRLYLNTGKNKEAIRAFLDVLEIQPAHENAQMGLFQAHLGEQDAVQARKYFTPLAEKYPGNPEIIISKSELLLLEKDTAASLHELNALLAHDAFNYEANFLKGEVLSKQGNKECVAVFEKTFLLDTMDVYPLEKIGDFYLEQKNTTQALIYYKQCVEQDLNYAYGFYKIAEVYYNADSLQKALTNYGFAIKANPVFARAYSGKARVYEQLQQADSALKYYELANNFDRELTEASEGLQRLKQH